MEEEKTEFKYEELSQDAQEYAVQTYGHPDYEWWDFSRDYWKEQLAEIGFEDAEIHFSGFSSQGDGACFDANCDLEKLVSALMYCGESCETIQMFQGMLEMTEALAEMLEIDDADYIPTAAITGSSNHYVHEKTRRIEVTGPELFEDKCQKLEETLESFRESLCHAIYNSLEEEYDWLCSEEAFMDSAEANEWKFDEEGHLL